MDEPNLKEKLILDLFAVKAIKLGEYKLKSGILSPYYLDLRVLVSYPYLLDLTADVFWESMRLLNFDVLVGVPYTALPISTAIALKHNQNMILARKERKDYGTRKLIEGDYHAGQKAIIIDDVITNGDSKLEVIRPLEEEGLTVKDIVILVDRGQGGPELLSKKGYNCLSIYTLKEIFEILLKFKRIDKKTVDQCIAFTNQTKRQFLQSANTAK